MTVKTGFIGLGNIGKPMAINLAESDFATTVFDINAEACEELAGLGAEVAEHPAALAKRAEVIGICVRNDADTYDVITGKNGLLETASPGTLIAVHSTVRPDTIEKLAAVALEKQVAVFDAPITGGAYGAKDKQLCYMVGADDETFAKARPVFETSAKTVVHAGPITAGMKLKLCNNLMTYLEFLAVHEGMKLAQKGGLSLDVLRQVTSENGVLNTSMQMLYDSKKGFDLDTLNEITAGFKAVAVKDLSIALEFADTLDISLPGAGVAREMIKQVYGGDR